MGAGGYHRGLSSVLGVVLLLAIVILVSGSVVVIGSGAIEDVQSRTVDQSAVTTMGELQSSVESIGSGDGARRLTFARGTAATGPGSAGGDVVAVDETAGEITIEVTDDSAGNTASATESLGAVVYEGDDGTLLYQGGGVFRLSDDGAASTVVSPPDFQYQYRGGAPTLRLSLPRIVAEGSHDRGSFDEDIVLRQTSDQTQQFPTTSIPNPLESGDTVEITVESRSAEAWASVFRERTDGTVTVSDFDGDGMPAARVTLSGPPSGSPMASGAYVGTRPNGVEFTNHVNTESYDSTGGVGLTPPGGGANAPVYVRGELTMNAGPSLNGDLTVEESATIDVQNDHSNFVGGTTIIGDNADVGGSIEFKERFSANGDLKAIGEPGENATFQDDVYVGGEVTKLKNAEIYGDLYVHDRVKINKNVLIDGNIYSEGKVSFANHIKVTGDVVSGDKIAGEEAAKVTIEGNQNEYASVDPKDPLERSLPSPDSVDDEIITKRDDFSSSNDNPGDGTIDPIEQTWGFMCDPCTLTGSSETSEYYIPDGINLGYSWIENEGETLVLDTTDGPIDIYTDDINVNKGRIEVRGDNPVRIYNGGKFHMSGTMWNSKPAEVVTIDDSGTDQTYRAPNVQVYMHSSKEAKITGLSSFTGVIHAPESHLTITNDATIYGAVIGKADQITAHAKIRFDEALLNPPAGAGAASGGPNSVTYLDVTTSEVTVADD